MRAVTSPVFLVGLKLNSADFQKSGFDENDSVEVVRKMTELGIDFIEISGGNYENLAMMHSKASTQKREAFFLDYAKKVRSVSKVPFIVTGGFRSEAVMNTALQSQDLDFISMARPFAVMPDLPNQIKNHQYQTIETPRIVTGVGKVDKLLGSVIEMGFYVHQINLLSQGKQPNLNISPWQVIAKTVWKNGKAGLSTGR